MLTAWGVGGEVAEVYNERGAFAHGLFKWETLGDYEDPALNLHPGVALSVSC